MGRMTTPPADREILTYADFGRSMRELAQAIVDDGYEVDVVLSIARGGLLIGGALGYALGVKNCSVMNVEFYTGVDERLEVPIMLPPVPHAVEVAGLGTELAELGEHLRDQRLERIARFLALHPKAIDLSGMKVLIADDVADTGRTLELVHEFCRDHVAESRTAVIYEKPHSIIKPDYAWKRTDAWIDFPWSVEPPVTRSA